MKGSYFEEFKYKKCLIFFHTFIVSSIISRVYTHSFDAFSKKVSYSHENERKDIKSIGCVYTCIHIYVEYFRRYFLGTFEKL